MMIKPIKLGYYLSLPERLIQGLIQKEQSRIQSSASAVGSSSFLEDDKSSVEFER